MIEKHELKNIKVLDTPSIRLIGFKARSALKDYHNLKHSSYIFPDEAAVRGSSVVYASLLQKMLEMDKIAICKMTARSNASMRMVALVPFKELVKDGLQVYPSGLYVIYLPFADDIRVDPMAPMQKAEEAQILAGVTLVRKLRIEDFDCRNFDNPQLQHHYMMLEAIALDRDESELQRPEDTVVPDFEGMERLRPYMDAFNSVVFGPEYVLPDPKVTPGKKAASKKRTRLEMEGDANDEESPAAKRKKMAEETDWPSLLANGTLSKCTIDQLKSYCSLNGIKGYSGLKKTDLVQRVTDDLNSKAAKAESS